MNTYKVIVDGKGNIRWYNEDGELHRVDGPAIEYANGSKFWYLNGEFHREDGPAVEYADGRKEWYLNGKLHREDGPAVECADGEKQWWVDGLEYFDEDYQGELLKRNSPFAGRIVEVEGICYTLIPTGEVK